MDIDFWHERWKAQQIGFHEETIHKHLQQFWSQMPLQGQEQVFVPLCGKSRDMCWLLEQGHPVLGVEVSPLAVQAFFDENQWDAQVEKQGALDCWQAANIRLLQGDFFALTANDLQAVQAVYDRASLIALPPDMRQRYAMQLNHCLASGTAMLLITLEYPQEQMKGPPFAVTEAEIDTLFGEHFTIKPLLKQDVLPQEPHFREKGLSALFENAYQLIKLR